MQAQTLFSGSEERTHTEAFWTQSTRYWTEKKNNNNSRILQPRKFPSF